MKKYNPKKQKNKNDLFNKIPLSNKELFSTLERDFKRINLLHKAETFEETQVMNLHIHNRQDLIKEKLDMKIREFDSIKNKKKLAWHKIKYIPTKNEKKNEEKIASQTNITLPSRWKILNMPDLDPKIMKKYIQDNKKKESSTETNYTEKPKFNQLNTLSNIEFLNYMISENKDNNNSQMSYIFNKSKVYDKIKSNLATSENFSEKNEEEKEEMKTCENFNYLGNPTIISTQTISSFNNKNLISIKRINSPFVHISNFSDYEKNLERDSKMEKMKNDLYKNKKLVKLYSQIKKIKPSKNFSNFSFYAPFKRPKVFVDRLLPSKIKNGVHNGSFSTIKPQFNMNLSNKEKIFLEDSIELKLINSCGDILKNQTKILKINKNLAEKHKLKFENAQQRWRYGTEYNFMKKVKRESRGYDRKTGLFVYGDLNGHKMANLDRLYGSKYNLGIQYI